MNNKQNDKKMKYMFERKINNINNFDSIDDDKHAFLNEKSIELRERFNKEELGKDYIYRFISYLFLTKIDWKSCMSIEEITILFILTIDPELKIYTIYENSSKIDLIKEQIIDEFGNYISGIANIERKYIERFRDINEFRFDYQGTKKLELE